MTALHLVAGVLFAVAALLVLVRIVRGPSILDRIIATDVLLITLALAVGMEMVVNRHTTTIPLMLVLAAGGALSTVAVSRYVSRQHRRARSDDEEAPE